MKRAASTLSQGGPRTGDRAGGRTAEPAAVVRARARVAKAKAAFLRKLAGGGRAKKPKGARRPVKFVTLSWMACLGTVWLRLPIWTINEKNCREHWSVKSRRTARQRAAVIAALMPRVGACGAKSFAVKLSRIAPRKLDVGDNLPRALSAIRDGIADCLGIDDGDPRIEWSYDQTTSPVYGVEVWIERRPT